MKRIITLFAVLAVFSGVLFAQADDGDFNDWDLNDQGNKHFYWNMGNFVFDYAIAQNSYKVEYSILEFNWFFKFPVYIGFSAARITTSTTENNWYSILPVEAGFQFVFNKDGLVQWKIQIYDRFEWQFRNFSTFFTSNSRPYNSVGVKFGAGSINDAMRYNRTYGSLFVEYTTANEWKVGITVDPVVLTVAIIMIILEAKSTDDRPTSHRNERRGKGRKS